MAQGSLAHGWDLELERGPDWLFVRPRPLQSGVTVESSLAEQIWALLEQSFSHRLVLELDAVGPFASELIDQLSWLQSQIHGHEGIMRLCGLSSGNEELLRQRDLESHFACYRDREEAVMGHPRPMHPR